MNSSSVRKMLCAREADVFQRAQPTNNKYLQCLHGEAPPPPPPASVKLLYLDDQCGGEQQIHLSSGRNASPRPMAVTLCMAADLGHCASLQGTTIAGPNSSLGAVLGLTKECMRAMFASIPASPAHRRYESPETGAVATDPAGGQCSRLRVC